MSSSEGSNVYDDLDPMELVSDDEYGPGVEIITSDSESDPEEDPNFLSDDDDMDDFQPFALPDGIVEDPSHLLPYPFILDLDDDVDDIPVFHVGNVDGELGDGEVFDVAILEVASPVVSVIDIPSYSTSDFDVHSKASVISSTLRVVGLEAHPSDNDDVSSALPATPAPTPSPTPKHPQCIPAHPHY
ncbi:hypothetical protein Hanom_Chr10g00915111 [Helianthus anomalus]